MKVDFDESGSDESGFLMKVVFDENVFDEIDHFHPNFDESVPNREKLRTQDDPSSAQPQMLRPLQRSW